MEVIIKTIQSNRRIDRDKAIIKLKEYFKEEITSCSNVEKQQTTLKQLFLSIEPSFVPNSDSEFSWFSKLGGVQFICCLLSLIIESKQHTEFILSSKPITTLLFEKLPKFVLEHLEHKQVRLRESLCQLLFHLCALRGVDIWLQLKQPIFTAIERNFVRDADEQAADAEKKKFATNESLTPSASTSTSSVSTQHHDTEGWKALETSFKCIDAMIRGCGQSILPEITTAVLDLIDRCLVHTNRFLRETGYFTYASLCALMSADTQKGIDFLTTIGDRLAAGCARGLADNWSQVRFAASVATRTLFEQLPDEKILHQRGYYALLLPRMCLNRYYLAQGVRIYSIESWRRVVGQQGKTMLVRYIGEVVAYYAQSSKADNHAVREAACHCIAELALRVDHDAVRPFVEKLIPPLMDCFKDASWPVRDAACTACAQFVSAFPKECECANQGQLLQDLYALWFAHLSDNIQSVRQNTAQALAGFVLKAYPEKALARIIPVIDALLPMAHKQCADSKLNASLENVSTFGVAKAKKIARDNDPALHTNQQVYSCGSLAPKLKRGAGCMDHGFSREKQPWEESDGAVFLIGELARSDHQQAKKLVTAEFKGSSAATSSTTTKTCYLDEIINLIKIRHFAHYFYFHVTIWNALTLISQSLGPTAFRPFFQKLLDDLKMALDETVPTHKLAKHAATQFASSLNKLYAPDCYQKEVKQHGVEIENWPIK